MMKEDDCFTFQKKMEQKKRFLLDFYDGGDLFERKPTPELLLFITLLMMIKKPTLIIFKSLKSRKVLGA